MGYARSLGGLLLGAGCVWLAVSATPAAQEPAGVLTFGPGVQISAALQMFAVPNPISVAAVAAAQETGGVLTYGQGIRISAALQMFAVPNPISVAALRVAAVSNPDTQALLYPEWQLELTGPIPLSARILERLKDGTPIPDKTKTLAKMTPDEMAYWIIQDEALIDCTRVPAQLFTKAAEDNAHVTFDHLFGRPNDYRGAIVPVEGRLLRVRKWRPSKHAQANGVPWVYEGFIAGQTPHRPPYIVLFTTLPEDVPVRETLSLPVKFYGYFIKLLKYPAENKEPVTNLLIGPTLYLEQKDVPHDVAPSLFSRDVLYATVGGLFVLAVAILSMHWWFHRGDKALHSQLAEIREREPLPFADEVPASPTPGSAVWPRPPGAL